MPRRTSSTAEARETPESLMRDINRKWPGAVKLASDPSLRIQRIPSGILSVDVLLGGGFARNRHTEIHGVFSAGKSYLGEHTVATAQHMGLTAAWVDAEKTYDPMFAETIGVDNDTLLYHEQESGNRCVDFMERMLRSGIVDVVVLDSIAALLPKSELESSMEDGSMGTEQARLMSKALRKLTTANQRTAIIYINQQREAVGQLFGKRSVTSGGRAMGFYAGVRLELVRTENIKRNTTIIDERTMEPKTVPVIKGHRVLMRVEKDKTGGAVQHSTGTFVFDYDLKGIDRVEDLIYLGRTYGLVHKRSNTWWVDGYDDESCASRAKFKTWLRRNVAVAEELEFNIKEAANSGPDEQEEEDDDD